MAPMHWPSRLKTHSALCRLEDPLPNFLEPDNSWLSLCDSLMQRLSTCATSDLQPHKSFLVRPLQYTHAPDGREEPSGHKAHKPLSTAAEGPNHRALASLLQDWHRCSLV